MQNSSSLTTACVESIQARLQAAIVLLESRTLSGCTFLFATSFRYVMYKYMMCEPWWIHLSVNPSSQWFFHFYKWQEPLTLTIICTASLHCQGDATKAMIILEEAVEYFQQKKNNRGFRSDLTSEQMSHGWSCCSCGCLWSWLLFQFWIETLSLPVLRSCQFSSAGEVMAFSTLANSYAKGCLARHWSGDALPVPCCCPIDLNHGSTMVLWTRAPTAEVTTKRLFHSLRKLGRSFRD